VYSGTLSASRISFNLLHAKDGSRVKQQYVCALDGEIVERSEMVKGYEFEKGQYVTFKADEIKALEEAGSDSIAIEQFVPLESVDPLYFDRSYLLSPDKHGDKPYALLGASLAESKRCGIGRWATHGREHIVVLRPTGGGLVMHQLFFKDEVRTIRDVGLPDLPEINPQEMKLARLLIDQLAEKKFDPNAYRDEFRERVEAAIEKKVKSGNEISHIEAPNRGAAVSSNVVDLMDVLKRSLDRKTVESVKAGTRKPPKRVTATTGGSTAKRTRRG
jgi:DNA end-binding protein Ku